MKMAMKSAFYESGGLSNMSIEYRRKGIAGGLLVFAPGMNLSST